MIVTDHLRTTMSELKPHVALMISICLYFLLCSFYEQHYAEEYVLYLLVKTEVTLGLL